MERSYRAFALCALGLEKVLQAELERLGLKTSGRGPGRVYFEAEAAGLFKANLCLRTAERVLIEAARFQATDFDALFDRTSEVHWEDWFALEDRLVIERVRIRDSALSAQTSVQSIVHKAIYERLGAVHGVERMPETGTERSARVYLEEDMCLIGLDTSGEALHKRGYRRATVEAPLKETLAAATLLLSGWNRRIPLLDPFCGSGTLLIEAALFGLDKAPGLGRRFALEDMPFADAAAFEAERSAATARIRNDVELQLWGSDVDESALEAARSNAERAGVASFITWTRGKAEDSKPGADMGYLLCNPPYGNRLGDEEDAEDLYRRLGGLAPAFKGWGLGFVTNRPDFGNFFGRRATAEHKVINGSEEQWFHWYPPGYEATEPRKAAVPPKERTEAVEARPESHYAPKHGQGQEGRGPRSAYQGDRGPRGHEERPQDRTQDRPFRGREGGQQARRPFYGRDTGTSDSPYRSPPRGDREAGRERGGGYGDRRDWGGYGHRHEGPRKDQQHPQSPRPWKDRGEADRRPPQARSGDEGRPRYGDRNPSSPRRPDDGRRPYPRQDGERGGPRGFDRDRGPRRPGEGRPEREGRPGYGRPFQGGGERHDRPQRDGGGQQPRRDYPPRRDAPPRRGPPPRRDPPPRPSEPRDD
jgi:putative N6-adenine-specific DNA methylase